MVSSWYCQTGNIVWVEQGILESFCLFFISEVAAIGIATINRSKSAVANYQVWFVRSNQSLLQDGLCYMKISVWFLARITSVTLRIFTCDFWSFKVWHFLISTHTSTISATKDSFAVAVYCKNFEYRSFINLRYAAACTHNLTFTGSTR